MRDPFGDTLGLKQSQIHRLRATYRRRVAPGELVSPELARHLTELSAELNRQLGVLLSRKGEIERVLVGDAGRITLPDIGRARAGEARLRGLRLVHTHLKSEPLTRDDLTDLALLRLDLVAAIGVAEGSLPGVVRWATLLPENTAGELWRLEEAPSLREVPRDLMARVAELEGELAAAARARPVRGAGRAILVSVSGGDRGAAQRSLLELRELARTAGVEVLDEVLQLRPKADPRYLVGKGKLQDIVLRSMQRLADMLIFDRDLTPAQASAIADETALKILDRSQLILDIFAQRATSRDGKLQVELAQLRYRLPRLQGRGDSLSRLAGGIGGRGPGETKLEIDRRRARDQIARLEREVDALSQVRARRRSRRNRKEMPAVALVGYTNAGKSTLLNALTYASSLVEDKLFATLDPLSRRLQFPEARELIVTDTVGFLEDLPRDLVAAFRATLEELSEADLLVLVLDGADPDHEAKLAAVERVLSELELSETPRLLAINKCDRLPPGAGEALARGLGGVAISAERREGLGALLGAIQGHLWSGPAAGAPSVRGLPDAGPEARIVAL
ncbi:MAG: GTPase HflX [Myxococcales bacterium]